MPGWRRPLPPLSVWRYTVAVNKSRAPHRKTGAFLLTTSRYLCVFGVALGGCIGTADNTDQSVPSGEMKDAEVPGLDAPRGTCQDGFQNQTESGIDCGGGCPPCPDLGVDAGHRDSGGHRDAGQAEPKQVAIFRNPANSPVQFAAQDLLRALEKRGFTAVLLQHSQTSDASYRIVLGVARELSESQLPDPMPGLEGYSIRTEQRGPSIEYVVVGGDAIGAMYGGLALAESIELNPDFDFDPMQENQRPHFEKRGQKMNIPLDARTTSYADAGDAAWNATQDVWDVTFWEAHFDEMARQRYNLITLWGPNPFPSMVNVAGYDVALDDQPQRWNWDCLQDWRSRDKDGPVVGQYNGLGDDYSGRGLNGYTGPLEHGCRTEAVPTNGQGIPGIVGEVDSIEEKERFWAHVMDYADQRGIDIYFITWNIISHVAADRDDEIIANAEDERLRPSVGSYTEQYFSASVRRFVTRFESLDGLGWYAGEGVESLPDRAATEYCARVYALSVHDALESSPGRPFKLIPRTKTRTHRDSDINEWIENMIPTYQYPYIDQEARPNLTVDFSFKYNTGRLYGDTTPGKHTAAYEEGDTSWTLWNIRNDDIFNVRIAAPYHVREMLCNFPRSGLSSDSNTSCDPPEGSRDPNTRGFHLGADGFVWTRDYESGPTSGRLQMEKHWPHFALWSRIAYDPDFDGFGYMVQQVESKYGLDREEALRLVEVWNAASAAFIRANDRFEKSDKDYGWYPEFPGVARTITGRWGWIDGDSFNHADAEFRDELRQSLESIDESIELHFQGSYAGELESVVEDIKALRWIGWIMYYRAEAASKSAGPDMANDLKSARDAWYQYARNIESRYGRRQMPARVSLFDIWNVYHQEMCEDVHRFGDDNFDCRAQHPSSPGLRNLCDLHDIEN